MWVYMWQILSNWLNLIFWVWENQGRDSEGGKWFNYIVIH